MPERHPWRSFTEAERAEAVGLALAVGAKEAAGRLGISRRTISSWLLRRTPEIEAAIVRSREDVAARLWEAVTAGTDAVLAGLRNPKARLGDKASALRIVAEAHALISGGPTARTESTVTTQPALTWDQKAELADWLDRLTAASDDELHEWLASGGAEMLRDVEQGKLTAGEESSDARS